MRAESSRDTSIMYNNGDLKWLDRFSKDNNVFVVWQLCHWDSSPVPGAFVEAISFTGHPPTPCTPCCLRFPPSNTMSHGEMRCVASSAFCEKKFFYHRKSKVYGYAYWAAGTCPSAPTSPSFSYTAAAVLQLYLVRSYFPSDNNNKKGTASFPASMKSNFPNHSAAYLGIIICRFARPLRETQRTVSRKIKQRISGWLHLKIVLPNNLNQFLKKKQNKTFYELEYNFCIIMSWMQQRFSNYLSGDYKLDMVMLWAGRLLTCLHLLTKLQSSDHEYNDHSEVYGPVLGFNLGRIVRRAKEITISPIEIWF